MVLKGILFFLSRYWLSYVDSILIWTQTFLDSFLTWTWISLDSVLAQSRLVLVLDSTKVDLTTALVHNGSPTNHLVTFQSNVCFLWKFQQKTQDTVRSYPANRKHRLNEGDLESTSRVCSNWPLLFYLPSLIGRHRSQLPVKWAGDAIHSAVSFMGYRSVIRGRLRCEWGDTEKSDKVRLLLSLALGRERLYFQRWRGSHVSPKKILKLH